MVTGSDDMEDGTFGVGMVITEEEAGEIEDRAMMDDFQDKLDNGAMSGGD